MKSDGVTTSATAKQAKAGKRPLEIGKFFISCPLSQLDDAGVVLK
jgi:hypothetical protein